MRQGIGKTGLIAALSVATLLTGGALQAAGAERWETLPETPAMPIAEQSGKAPVNGIQMYYAIYGKGKPVLLIHGGFGWADYWTNVVADLSKDHEVIVADSRGHGRSTRTDAPFSYDLMASDYLALLDYLKLDKVQLVGWSDGADIGLDIALHHPERLTKLFAQAANATVDGALPPNMDLPTESVMYERAGEMYAKLSSTPDQFDNFSNDLIAMWSTQPNWTDSEMASISVPTNIVIGDHDEMVSLSHDEHLAQIIPGAKLTILKDVSHFALFQDPQGYIAALRAFLD